MYTTWYIGKRHGTQNESNGWKTKTIQVFVWGKPALMETLLSKGAPLNFTMLGP